MSTLNQNIKYKRITVYNPLTTWNARLNMYAVKCAQFIHGIIPVRDSNDIHCLQCAQYQLVTGKKLNVRHLRVIGCPATFKRCEISESRKRTKNKYLQQGIRGIFVGFPDDLSG